MKETKFLSFTEKLRLANSIENGGKESLKFLINELDRLEQLLKGYEIIIRQAYDRAKSDYNKTPKK
jgi:hypothetical protein